ncbi:unnamed protein product [Parnassius apollo]|uniref:(apollo) hypothetical protein n=1 Tax=Parnassius apollo TaxID=110799 RepID=A0A8S3WI29_PARAO|nr:unnamed protein product [Parnassius apollo]
MNATNTSAEQHKRVHGIPLGIPSIGRTIDGIIQRLSKKNGLREDDSSWYWDPPAQSSKIIDHDLENQYKIQIQALQKELSSLKDRDEGDNESNSEIFRLKEENKNLINSLDDLDSQHRLAMEKLLTLKTELQKNFEVLKLEHEDLKNSNDEYASEIKNLLLRIGERDKEITNLKSTSSDYDTLQHKYQNLERIHSLMRENAEKFQEENQDLHEEVFKLQEQVTKLEHDLEVAVKQTESTNMVPREKYEEILKECEALKHRRSLNRIHLDEINIDDNAKGVIEALKRDISDLKHKLAQRENDNNRDISDNKVIKADKVMQLYNRYVNFELPIDYVGEIPSSNDNIVLYKLEGVFKTVNSFKKDIDNLEQKLSEKNLNISNLQTHIDDLTTENDFLTTDIQQYEKELDEMKKNNDFLISEITALRNASKLEPIIETHEDNYAKLETELADCNRINKTFESEIKKIERELAEVRIEKSKLQESLADLKQKYTSMLNELEICKTQTKNYIELESNTNIDNNEKLQKTIDELDDLKKRLNAANAKNEQFAIDIHITENDKVLLTKEVDDLKNALEVKSTELQSTKNILESKIKKLEKKVEETEKYKEDVENKKDTLAQSAIFVTSESKADGDKNPEGSLISERLQNSHLENTTLKNKIDELNSDINQLKLYITELSTENNSLKNRTTVDKQNIELLQRSIDDYKEKAAQSDIVNRDFMALKEENKKLLEMRVNLESELFSNDKKIVSLEEEFNKLVSDLNEKDSLIDSLNNTISENNLTLQNLNEAVSNLQNSLTLKNQELELLNKKYEEVSENLNRTSEILNRSHEELSLLHTEKQELDKQLTALNDEVNNKNTAIAMLTDRLDKLEKTSHEYKSLAESKNKEIKELNQSFVELTDKMKTTDSTHQNDEYAKLNEEISTLGQVSNDLNNQLEIKQREVSELEHKMKQLENVYMEYQSIIEKTQSEKANLINLINLKHNESLQYHNEIQRLNHVILEQTNEYKRIIEEKDLLLQNSTNNCSSCDSLRVIIKEKDEIIMSLNQNVSEYEKLKTDLTNAGEAIKNLTKRCEDLDKSLTIQLETVKKLTTENAQLSEQEQNSTRELERLRHHLMEMEENYTQELMTSEQKLSECQIRLHQVEEKAKQTSTVYTSNSIRANQEVETLRNQIKLLEKQREEVQARLSEAEDARNRNEAALTNLQIVLEQFQLEKERDIANATEKIRNKMEEAKNQNQRLQEEIARLNSKLEESLAGLQAASRLGDQVETKTAQINDLKEQVRTLQTSVAAAEERYYNAISNQQDKVDKNLVKNLVMNYVVSAAQSSMNKTQVLRVLSTVLDFNQQECEKLGLVRSSNTADSLAAEFVKFLQNESKPRAPLPNMMGLGQSRSTTPTSRRNSTMGPNPMFDPSHKRNPSTGSNNLLFQNLDNVDTASQHSTESEPRVVTLSHMETGVNQTRNNEGAILKHVLKDM